MRFKEIEKRFSKIKEKKMRKVKEEKIKKMQRRNSFQFSREIDEMDDELRDGRERLKYEININTRR